MLITNYTSIKEIVLNYYRNTGSDRDVNLDDIAYWTYEVFEKIGYPMTYIPKVYGHKENPDWDFDEYKVKLPDDFHTLRALSVDGKVAIPTSNSFHDLLDGACCGWDNLTLPQSIETYYDNFGNTFSPSSPPLTKPSKMGLEPVTFSINNSYITFNVENGKACMAYWAFPVDNEGLPLIPDIHVFKNAVAMYIQERIDYKFWRKGVITDKVYMESKKERNWAIAQAHSTLYMPDLHQMESLKNQLIKMVVRKDDYMQGFRSASKQGHRGRY